MLEQYGFKQDYAQKCLNNNKHNQVTTIYYLVHKRQERQGLISSKLVKERGKSEEPTKKRLFANSRKPFPAEEEEEEKKTNNKSFTMGAPSAASKTKAKKILDSFDFSKLLMKAS